MEKLKERAKKGTISVRKRPNGFEARVSLNLDEIGTLRITRFSSISESEVRRKLGEAIADAYLKYGRQRGFTDEYVEENCSNKLMRFTGFKDAQKRRQAIEEANKVTLFKNVARSWLDYKRKHTEAQDGRKLGQKTFDNYVYTTIKDLMPYFADYDVNKITREEFQKHISKIKGNKKAKNEVLVMKMIMDYAVLKNWAKRNPISNIILPIKTKKEISYINSEEQERWLNCIEKDGRQWTLLFATLIQTGMRPEERLWS